MSINKSLLICFIFSGLFASTGYLQGQAEKCKTATLRNARLKANPGLSQDVLRLEQYTQRWIAEQKGNTELRSIITLPVVVHVVWRTSVENISDAQIHSQIEVLNEDFRLLNAGFNNTPSAFANLAADIEVEFCLASIDPDGNPTTGITRTQTDIDNIGETEDWYSTFYGGKDAWDVERYINIWVCDIGEDGTLGFASIPETADPPESDGLVIGHQYFGRVGTASSSEFNNLGRTVTHEMGHYFNLEHLWGPDEGGCEEDDFVNDTPNQFEDSFACPTFPLFDDCTFDGDGLQFMNFMDYSDDICMTMFSQGQKLRMLAALNGARSGLIDAQACALATSASSVSVENLQVRVYPNPVSHRLQIEYLGLEDAQALHFQVFDLAGNLLISWQGSQQRSVEVNKWASGVYILRCREQPLFNQRIVIQ